MTGTKIGRLRKDRRRSALERRRRTARRRRWTPRCSSWPSAGSRSPKTSASRRSGSSCERGYVKVDAVHADHGAARLRHRRRGQHPLAGARGIGRGDPGGRAHGRAASRSRSTTTASRPAPTASPRWRASGLTEAKAQGAGLRRRRSASSRSPPSARRRSSARPAGFVKIVRRQEIRRDPRRAHRRRPRHRPDRRGVRGAAAGRHRSRSCSAPSTPIRPFRKRSWRRPRPPHGQAIHS